MHTQETKLKFLELRANNWSLARIAAHLGVNPRTLIDWQHQFQEHITNLQNLQLEAMQEKVLASREEELKRLAGQLNRIEEILTRRDLETVSTESLFYLASTLRAQLRKQRQPPTYSETPKSIFPLDYPDQPTA